MKGNGIYFAFASLLGITAALADRMVSFIGLCLLVILLMSYKKWHAGLIAILVVISVFMYFRSEIAERNQVTQFRGDETEFTITFQDKIKVDGDLLSAEVKTSTGELMMMRYEISSEIEKEVLTDEVRPGLNCSVRGQLKEPSSVTNPNGFDYRLYLQRNRIYWILVVPDFSLTQCSSKVSSPITFFQKLRFNGISYLNDHFPDQSAGLAAALIFGDRNGIDHDVITSYERLGIVHLLAISGLHVAMLAGIIYYLGLRIGITRERMTHFLFIILPIYALLTGAAPSVNRSVLMLMLALAVKKFHFHLPTSDIISAVFIGYVLISPYAIFDIGLQLSFLITLSLILSAQNLPKKAQNSMVLALQTSFICLLSSLPIMFYYFYEVSLISLFVNIIYIPLYSWIMMPGLMLLYFVHLGAGEKAEFLVTIFDLFTQLVNAVSDWLSEVPFAVLTLGIPSNLVLILYAAAIISFFALWEKRSGSKSFVRILLLPASVVFIHYAVNSFSPYGEVTMIDVGQGDSIFIQLPYGQGNYLIDTGGLFRFPEEKWRERKKPFEIGRDTIVPFLKSKGVRTLDKLMITHGDVDHIGGSEAILNEMDVKEVLMAAEAEPSEAERKLEAASINNDIEVHNVQAGIGWKSGQSFFHIMLPGESPESMEENNGSIVMYAEIGGLRWLFMGDAEESGEKLLIDHYGNLRADVLKVGHHGSKTSTSIELLQTVQPQYALISAGRNNLYGHPHGEVIDKLNEEKTFILRTDLHGAITYKFKGGQGTFFTVIP
ncbi:DNA internalization-related competence protein ComEC/Rec2 [Bacillus mesophilum]|uniref:DNA internalization-related competence protein ComEC/Rec2 n=1 Tax=Bacillus mesophilum TaxID=1071718 RepID=A0A7V7RNC9_9BACI|nr:DNA internalization-related competence protein ComEC/Rec2 [Bacillus mesophilum]KAB2333934.1 DNA internalization-related competence protein ComEC/Rec2 [Bacillus mesophilum]